MCGGGGGGCIGVRVRVIQSIPARKRAITKAPRDEQEIARVTVHNRTHITTDHRMVQPPLGAAPHTTRGRGRPKHHRH